HINAVVLRGENDHEVPEIVDYFSQWANDTEVRFIEYMPFEERWHQNVRPPARRERLEQRYTLVQEPSPAGAGPARTWRIRETGLLVGFVSPLSAHFLGRGNSVRLIVYAH